MDRNTYAIFEDHTGAIWIGAWDRGLTRFEKPTIHELHHERRARERAGHGARRGPLRPPLDCDSRAPQRRLEHLRERPHHARSGDAHSEWWTRRVHLRRSRWRDVVRQHARPHAIRRRQCARCHHRRRTRWGRCPRGDRRRTRATVDLYVRRAVTLRERPLLRAGPNATGSPATASERFISIATASCGLAPTTAASDESRTAGSRRST